MQTQSPHSPVSQESLDLARLLQQGCCISSSRDCRQGSRDTEGKRREKKPALFLILATIRKACRALGRLARRDGAVGARRGHLSSSKREMRGAARAGPARDTGTGMRPLHPPGCCSHRALLAALPASGIPPVPSPAKSCCSCVAQVPKLRFSSNMDHVPAEILSLLQLFVVTSPDRPFGVQLHLHSLQPYPQQKYFWSPFPLLSCLFPSNLILPRTLFGRNKKKKRSESNVYETHKCLLPSKAS